MTQPYIGYCCSYAWLSLCIPDVDLYHVLLTRQEGYRVVSWTLHFTHFSFQPALFHFEGVVSG